MQTSPSDEPVNLKQGDAAESQEAVPSPIVVMTGNEDDPDAPKLPETLAILPIRGLVVFPGTVVPLTLGRPSALKLVDEQLPQSKIVGLVSQRREDVDRPAAADIFEVGVACQVLKLMRHPDGTVVLLVQALRRFTIRRGHPGRTLPPRRDRAARQHTTPGGRQGSRGGV